MEVILTPQTIRGKAPYVKMTYHQNVCALTPAVWVTSWADTIEGDGEVGVTTTTTIEARALTIIGAGGTSCKTKLGVNLVACLKAWRLKKALDFLRPNTPTLSSHFLLAITEEWTLGATSATPTTRPISPASWPPFSNSGGDSRRWCNPTNGSSLLYKGPPSKVTHDTSKISNNSTTNVNSDLKCSSTTKK